MRNRRESIRVGALALLLTVVGVAGATWPREASAQERLMLSRTHSAGQVNAGMPGGKDMLIAVGTLQFLGLVVFEAMAYVRRRSDERTMAPLAWRVRENFSVGTHVDHTRQAA